jgi:peptidase E
MGEIERKMIRRLKAKVKRGMLLIGELKELKAKVKKGVPLIGVQMSMEQHEPNNS